MTFILRLWPYLAALVAGSIVAGLLVHGVDQRRYMGLEKSFNAYQLASAQALADAQAQALADQARQAQQIRQIEQDSQAKALNDEKTIASLRAKYSGLRILARCPASAALPKAIDPAIGLGARPEPELSRPDDGVAGEDLIVFAQDAERVRGQLMACQGIVRSLQ